MTTPAENVNTVLQKSSVYTQDQSWPGGIHYSGVVNNVYSWYSKSRPESSTNPKAENGWRDCGGWFHSGRQIQKGPGTNRATVYWSDGSTDVQMWSEGSFWTYNPAAVPSFPSNLGNRALVDALNKLKNQDINLGTYFAEGKQTFRMVATRVKQIAAQVRRFQRKFPDLWKLVVKHQRGSRDCRLWDKIPRAWLEIQYGWNPLLNDIIGGLRHLEKRGKTLGQVVNVGSNKTQIDVYDRHIDSIATAAFCETRVKTQHKCHISLWYKLKDPQNAELSSLGLINPGEWLWEAVPFSFVVDWLVPIGSWMSSLTADTGWSYLGGSRSEVSRMVEFVTAVSHVDQSGPSTRLVTSGPGVVIRHGDCFNFKRICLPMSPVPGLYYKNPFTATHVLNAIALLAVAFQRR